MAVAEISQGTVYVKGRHPLFRAKGFGIPVGDRVLLTPCEAMYLFEKGKIKVREGGNFLTADELFHKLSAISEDFPRRYPVYRDLRERGYVVCETDGKPDFLVYEPSDYKRAKPPSFSVLCVIQGSPLRIEDLRNSLSKFDEVLLAVSDRRGSVVYYRASRLFEG